MPTKSECFECGMNGGVPQTAVERREEKRENYCLLSKANELNRPVKTNLSMMMMMIMATAVDGIKKKNRKKRI